MIYSVCSIEVPPGKVNDALAGLGEAFKSNRVAGELRGCWYAELGRLNRILAISAHATTEALAEAQRNALASENAYGVADIASGITLDAFASFPDFDVLPAGEHGPVYEIRTYQLRKAGLAPTLALWAKAVPARSKLSPLATAMYAISGLVPRFMHIWPYRSLNDRMRVREDAVKQGLWPPPGGLAHIEQMQSEIYLPAAFSPAR